VLDLSLTAEQQGQLAEWHAFAEEVIRPVAAEHDRDESTPMEVLEEAWRRGLYSLDFWAAGLEDPTGLHWLLANEELFWGCAGIALQLTVSGLALAGLSAAGTPEQLMQCAPECFGSPGDIKLGALAVTEPTGGSDVASLTTTARRDGSGWVLDGPKMFIGNGGIADVHVVVAAVDPDLGHRGQASFVVPKGTAGLVPVRRLSKLGLRAAYTGEFRLESCRIPADHLLGGQDKLDERLDPAGHDEDTSGSTTLKALERSRPVVAAQAIGVARAAYEYALAYACERRTFGHPLLEHPPIAELLADIAMEIDAAACLRGGPPGWAPLTATTKPPRARCRSSRPPRWRRGSPKRPSRSSAGTATSPTTRWRSGTEMRRCSTSTKAPPRSSGWSSPGRFRRQNPRCLCAAVTVECCSRRALRRCSPAAIGIPSYATCRSLQVDHRQRRLWWEWRCVRALMNDGGPRFEKVYQDGHVQFVDCRTGEVRWRDPVPETERKVAGGF